MVQINSIALFSFMADLGHFDNHRCTTKFILYDFTMDYKAGLVRLIINVHI